ncbi:MAG: Asp-tRNA(Asn)/Glu-tRNA(Gln) amidotransferase subunit GatB [Anaerolineales bacterium]
MEIEAVIGLETHAELETESKMFCACPVVDPATAEPNSAVCPICAGMPGVLPTINQRAVEYAVRVALALECEIYTSSIFARKNYFYPDLPKGYQISQYEKPLARNGQLRIQTSNGERTIKIRRVHLEEDTGKLTHIKREGESYSLVDLNRAGIPLLEIVSEPDLRSAEEVRAYATGLRSLLRYLGVNSGDMQKGVMRIEPNVSVRVTGQTQFGTRVEIKNLNSFRALERAVAYEIQRQSECLKRGKKVAQVTVGWDENKEITFVQRTKEEEQDYRYFPEPDLPPLVITSEWIEHIRANQPELPIDKIRRFQEQYGLNKYDAGILVDEKAVAEYFERAVAAAQALSKVGSETTNRMENTDYPADIGAITPKTIANWITGEIFALLKQSNTSIEGIELTPQALVDLINMVVRDQLNQNTARWVLSKMLMTGKTAAEIVAEQDLGQVSDTTTISNLVEQILGKNPDQVSEYLQGKQAIYRWLIGEVMRAAKGQANPQVVHSELQRQLDALKDPSRRK